MTRIEQLTHKAKDLYQAKKETRTEWADWLFSHHIFLVAKAAERFSERFGGDKDLAVAASLLHDIGDAVISRFDPKHEEESKTIARRFLKETGFRSDEIKTIVDDAMTFHGCTDGNRPKTLEGKIMASADAYVHLTSDFYTRAYEAMKGQKTNDEIKAWALPKLERDFFEKILFNEIQNEAKTGYETNKRFFEALK
ncbi:MAG TPA: HD domain-containing protein [Patescibacteria group bacterium]|nr:HD domain-containing protein [Patescibacteria group bacterium]